MFGRFSSYFWNIRKLATATFTTLISTIISRGGETEIRETEKVSSCGGCGYRGSPGSTERASDVFRNRKDVVIVEVCGERGVDCSLPHFSELQLVSIALSFCG